MLCDEQESFRPRALELVLGACVQLHWDSFGGRTVAACVRIGDATRVCGTCDGVVIRFRRAVLAGSQVLQTARDTESVPTIIAAP
jgi:hypothetical protein